MSGRRVVVTGMGAVSPLGSDLDRLWDGLIHGASGIGPITNFDPADHRTKIAGQAAGFDPDRFLDKKAVRKSDRFVQFGIGAAAMAVESSGLDFDQEDRDRAGVLVGTGIGGIQEVESSAEILFNKGPGRMMPYCIPEMITNILAGYVAIHHGLRGPNFCITSACTTSAHCIGEAMRMIQYGDADIMVAGGSEASIVPISVGGFNALRALSTNNDDPEGASRPFDRDRDGFVMGEGSGVLVLEEAEHAAARGADIWCELAGYGRTCDAYHVTAPDQEGRGGARGMSLAMDDAGLNPDQIDYINAHGTSTPMNDPCETRAIKTSMGEENARRVPISSTKSMTGHLLGAAGALEAIICALTMRHGMIPPTINYTTPDPDCDLDYVPNEAREAVVRTCLSNSLGFGGHNATLCMKAV